MPFVFVLKIPEYDHFISLQIVFRANQTVVNCLAHGLPSLLSEVQGCKLVSEVLPKFAPALMMLEFTDCCVNYIILKPFSKLNTSIAVLCLLSYVLLNNEASDQCNSDT